MSSPIDPTRRAARLRRAARAQAAGAEADRAQEAQEVGGAAGLPVPVGAPRAERPAGAAIFDAQLLGQDGEKRGLRAGPLAIDRAKASYNRVEWSGAKDRRSRKGRYKTEI
jgi:hypothetical protein